ncbi:MAG: acetyl-CoA acetyltransferase [Caulobacteraceae bacterium]|nr:acetyl-CoA acetyltransferase [Caulobacteraceae bacterium]
MDDRTPVLIGVGEASERIDEPTWRGLSPADLAGEAAAAALADAHAKEPLAPHIDVVAGVRQFETSGPRAEAPFGRSDNFPRAVAKRIKANPARAILEPVGGQGPQHLVNEFGRAIAKGEAEMVLLCGAEAISTIRHLASRGEKRDWSEETGGELEDRGYGEALITGELGRHGGRTPITVYALFENARRARMGLSRKAYALEMGRLFAPFTKVAAANPHAMSREVYSADELATITGPNRLTSDPFPRRMVARDQTNQGAAVLLTSVGKARALGVPEDRFVYLHGGADVRERTPIERQDLSSSPASVMAARRALDRAGVGVDKIDYFDFYSCFPIAVFNVSDGLGIAADDPRALTMTGGLPYFGGAGNNYSMHGIAQVAQAVRAKPGSMGMVTANGGFLSKYSVGIYSTRPAPPPDFDDSDLQAEVDAWPVPPVAQGVGEGVVETYTIDYSRQPEPVAIVIGSLRDGGARFVARTDQTDGTLARRMAVEEPLGARVTMVPDEEGRAIIQTFEPARLKEPTA